MAKRGYLSLVLVAVGCASSGDTDSTTGSSSTVAISTVATVEPTTTPTTAPRPFGPAAEISSQVVGGDGVFIAEPSAVDLGAAGYVEHEYFAEGTATSYHAIGELRGDGRWSLTPEDEAAYRTRILVRVPAGAADFSGTVVVEWLNVSGGVDADPEWVAVHEEITRRGDAWVGVSAQLLGVAGGTVAVPVDVAGAEVAGQGLVAIDAARYGSLTHPGDGFSFDIYTQVARAIRAGAGMSGLQPQRLIAAGESQSAFALVTYYNGVQPLTQAFDGFFVHSRSKAFLPFVAAGESAGILDALSGSPTVFRTDEIAPVMNLQTETDVTGILNSALARQPDDERFRLWEVAGTAHFDQYLLGDTSDAIGCRDINNGPLHVVAKAALRALTTWVEGGAVPPSAPRLEVTDEAAPQIRRDGDGIALGGIRTPPVDVPVATLSGVPATTESVICLLLGSTVPFTAERIRQLYASSTEYLERFEALAAAAIAGGYVLSEDRAALLAFAQPDLVGA